jgi:hypothetical protein
MESSMQIRFIQQLFTRGFIDELLMTPSCWEGTMMIIVHCGKILEELLRSVTF